MANRAGSGSVAAARPARLGWRTKRGGGGGEDDTTTSTSVMIGLARHDGGWARDGVYSGRGRRACSSMGYFLALRYRKYVPTPYLPMHRGAYYGPDHECLVRQEVPNASGRRQPVQSTQLIRSSGPRLQLGARDVRGPLLDVCTYMCRSAIMRHIQRLAVANSPLPCRPEGEQISLPCFMQTPTSCTLGRGVNVSCARSATTRIPSIVFSYQVPPETLCACGLG